MVSPEDIAEIKEQAIRADWEYAFKGKSHGNRHLFRVVTIAKFLAEKEGLSEESKSICEAGAWLHDIGLGDGRNDDDPPKIRRYALALLSDLTIDDEMKSKIADCAQTHEGTEKAVHIEAAIVHDADVLDKMGMLGVIRHTWKITNLIKPNATPTEISSMLQEHLAERQRNLYTPTAVRLAHFLNKSLPSLFRNQKKACELIAVIMDLARKGMVTEEIAPALALPDDDSLLMQQLRVEYEPELLQAWYDRAAAGTLAYV